ncbi:uncharacterized protein LOC125237498 isoform X2 [Leguminivora glycinivorella]|uniref:uncharacterized protein LOC125237498 isoform X2 n=1 Tax=Leguminivora glycinivorella TaxID=1035111 RepID=UPI00200FABD5|nr:uncharacterized protein LOC125237498 isoform X2 [Leguminivora glycinivorella]
MAPNIKEKARLVDEAPLAAPAPEPPAPGAGPREYALRLHVALKFAYWHLGALYGLWLAPQARLATVLFNMVLFVGMGLGTSVGAHRLWAHRAFKAAAPLQALLLLLQTLASQHCVVNWVRDHSEGQAAPQVHRLGRRPVQRAARLVVLARRLGAVPQAPRGREPRGTRRRLRPHGQPAPALPEEILLSAQLPASVCTASCNTGVPVGRVVAPRALPAAAEPAGHLAPRVLHQQPRARLAPPPPPPPPPALRHGRHVRAERPAVRARLRRGPPQLPPRLPLRLPPLGIWNEVF